MRHWGQTHEHVWAILRQRGFKIHVAGVGVNPDADDRAQNVLNGWAQDREGVRGGSWREAKLREEFDEVSRAVRHGDSRIIARYGGFDRTSRRYVELKDLLANPLPYRIRIDTFEIWRSRRIYPNGVSIYEAPV